VSAWRILEIARFDRSWVVGSHWNLPTRCISTCPVAASFVTECDCCGGSGRA